MCRVSQKMFNDRTQQKSSMGAWMLSTPTTGLLLVCTTERKDLGVSTMASNTTNVSILFFKFRDHGSEEPSGLLTAHRQLIGSL